MQPLPQKTGKSIKRNEHPVIPPGTWVTMITPFTEENQIDEAGVRALVDWYVEKGLDGIFAVCQSSEMFHLSLRERVALAQLVVEHAAGRIPVIASGHVSEAIEDQIEELAAIAGTGVEAVVLVSNRLAKRGEPDCVWQANAEWILAAIPNVIFGIYECPYPYKRLMSPELLAWCARTGRFAFLKDTCCNLDQIRAKLEAVAGTPLGIYNANSATALASLQLGCAGFSGVMLNFHPEVYNWLCHHWQQSPEEAERLQNFATVASLIELQMYPTNAKYHMSLEGVSIGYATRSRDVSGFDRLKQIEVEHLHGMWKSFPMPTT